MQSLCSFSHWWCQACNICVIPHANSSCFSQWTEKNLIIPGILKWSRRHFLCGFWGVILLLLLRCESSRGLSPVCNPSKVLVTWWYSNMILQSCYVCTMFTFEHNCNHFWSFVDEMCALEIITKHCHCWLNFFTPRSDDALSTVFLPHAFTLQPSWKSLLM